MYGRSNYQVFGMPVQNSSLTANAPPVAPPSAGAGQSGPEPGGMGMYGAGASSYEDGGVIPSGNFSDQPLDDQNADQDTYTIDLTDAINAAQKALEFGRAQSGMPAKLFGGDQQQPSSGDEQPSTIGTMSKLASKTGPGLDAGMNQKSPPQAPDNSAASAGGTQQEDAPVQEEEDQQSFDEGGAVEDDGGYNTDQQMPQAQGVMPAAPQQQAQGQDPQTAMRGYVMGAGALSPEESMALERQADPGGRMDPSERKLRAVAMAGTPDKQWAALQHYRQKFNVLGAFAKAALHGTQSRPASLQAATKAATQAFENLPDGKSVTFMPAHDKGIAVHVKPLAQGGAQSFGNGGEVEGKGVDAEETEDNTMGNLDQNMLDSQQTKYLHRPEVKEEKPQEKTVYIPPARFEELMGQYDQIMDKGVENVIAPPDAMPPNAQPTEGKIDQTIAPGPAQLKPPPRKHPDAPIGQEVGIHTVGGKWDDSRPEFKKPDAPNDAYGDIETRANRVFPLASQRAQRDEYIAKLHLQAQKNEGGEHIAKVKDEGSSSRSDQRGKTMKEIEEMKGDVRRETNQNTNATKRDIAGGREEGLNYRGALHEIGQSQRNYMRDHPHAKPAEVKKYVEAMGEQYVPPQAPVQGQPQQPQGAPQQRPPQRPQQQPQQMKQPPQGAVEKLRSIIQQNGGQVPDAVRSEFNARWPGALERILAGQ